MIVLFIVCKSLFKRLAIHFKNNKSLNVCETTLKLILVL